MESLKTLEEAVPDNEDGDDDISDTLDVLQGTRTALDLVTLEGGRYEIIAYSKRYLLEQMYDPTFRENKEMEMIVEGDNIKYHKGMVEMEAKHYNTYDVQRVVSPFEFYMKKATATPVNVQEEMQKYYNSLENKVHKFRIIVSRMKLQCFAYLDPETDLWFRVRIMDTYLEGDQNMALAYICDTGQRKPIYCENLRRLTKDFLESPEAKIVKCYLYDVLPMDGSMRWSLDAIRFLKSLIMDRRVKAVGLIVTNHPTSELSPDTTPLMGAVLHDGLESDDSDTVNWLMVKNGYARPIGIMANSSAVFDIRPGLVPYFELSEDYSNRPQRKEVPLKEIVARAVQNSGLDMSIPIMSYHHYEAPTKILPPLKNCLPEAIRPRLAWMRMSYLHGPGKMYMHTARKKHELNAMHAKLRQDFKKKLHSTSLCVTDLKVGSFVMCDLHYQDILARAIVTMILGEDNKCKVLLVDYGNVMIFGMSMIFKLPEEYQSIPAFVHRAHLCDIRPSYDYPAWHETIDNFFRRAIVVHEDANPLYYAHHFPDASDMIEFSDFREFVLFDDKANRWVASQVPQLPRSRFPNVEKESSIKQADIDMLNSLKHHPLLATHFYSHPVQIFFEVQVKEFKKWVFENLSDYFVEREYAEFVREPPEPDKNKLHKAIINGFCVESD